MTNYERIKNMTVDEMAGWILDSNENHYSFCDGCRYESFSAPHCTAGDEMREGCLSSIQRWLESEAEE